MVHSDPPAPDRETVFFTSTRGSHLPVASVRGQPAGQRVLACVDDEATGGVILSHALVVARSLGLPLTLARVMETPDRYDIPADPVEWQVNRRQGQERLERLKTQEGAAEGFGSVLLAGQPSEELNRWMQDHAVSLAALGTHDAPHDEGLGSTAQKVLSSGATSLLLVPPLAPRPGNAGYRRLLVPLDGSSRAESVVPVAARIARKEHAEVLLVHVVPQLEAVQPRWLDADTRALQGKLDQRHLDYARAYLDDLRHRVIGEDVAARTIVVAEGNVREQVRRLAIAEGVDLIVLSSHGSTALADVPCGSVTEYLANHAPAPLLVIRPNFGAAIRWSETTARQFEPALH